MKTELILDKPLVQSPDTTPIALPSRLAAGLVFLASGAVLVLEILSVRLLTPYVGLTLETTTSIIGAVLAGIALGAWVGGWTADRVNPRKLTVALLVGGGMLVLLTVPIVRVIGPSASGNGNLGALEVTFAALVPVAAILSAVSPTVAHLQLHDLSSSGTIVGRLSAWATAGALVGTFGTGFVLVPLFPVGSTVAAIGVVLVVGGVLLGVYMRLLQTSRIVATAVVLPALMVLTPVLHAPCDAETTYHCVRVETFPGVEGKLLILDREPNSFVANNPRVLAFRYTRWMGDSIDALYHRPAPLDGVFVGGGGFTMPRWLLATRPGSRAQVYEVDPKLVEFDRQHLGLSTSPELRVTVGDARVQVRRQPTASADLAVGDAFSGLTVPWQLMTVEWLREVQRILRPGGIYMLNMIDLRPLRLLRAEAATLMTTFAHVRLIALPGSNGRPAGGNEVLLATNGRLPLARTPAFGAVMYEEPYIKELVANAEPLRDDYAPVDQLQTR